MSAWQEVVEEKAKIDALTAEGFVIADISEGLDGDLVRFARGTGQQKETTELLLLTADARKYLGVVLILQLRGATA